MKKKLPEPLRSYFDAVNREDVDAMLTPFAANAVVTDEVEDGAEAAIVIGLVSGAFPWSPIRLRYVFRLSEGTITHLEIK